MNYHSDREKINILKSFIGNPLQQEKNPKIVDSIVYLLENHKDLKRRIEVLESTNKFLCECIRNHKTS